MIDIATWVGIGASTAIGVAGFVFAGIANRRAKIANELAEASNRVAARSNEIAENANKLSEEANALVGQSVSQQSEDWFVNWKCDWDAETSSIRVANKGRDAALKPSVVVAGDDIHRVHRSNHTVEPGQKILIEFPELRQQAIDFNDAAEARWIDRMQRGVFSSQAERFQALVEVTVRWQSGAGVPGQSVFELKLT
jgi:hypothetical protein